MQKVVILLVYEDKIIRNTLSLFYEDLKQYNLHEDLNVYLLKIYEDFTKNECNFFQLEKNAGVPGNNMRCVLDKYFDFKSTRGLYSALNFIKGKHSNSLFFLIVHGHGQGLGFFKEDINQDKSDPATKINHSAFEIKYAQDSYFGYFKKNRHNKQYDILWNYELSKAIYLVKGMYFEFALFNTCNTLLIDNCYLFSKKIKFLMGTESYVAENFLTIVPVLDIINIYDNQSTDSVVSVFNIYKHNAEEILDLMSTEQILNLSFFLIPLDDFPLILLKLNEIVLRLLRKYFYSIDWLVELRSKIYSFDTSFDYVDLCGFLDAVEQKFADTDHFLLFRIRSLKAMLKKTPIKNWVYKESKHITEYNGVAIYLPKIDEEYYNSLSVVYYYSNNINYFLGRSNWDRFIRSINIMLYKSQQQKKTFDQLITPI